MQELGIPTSPALVRLSNTRVQYKAYGGIMGPTPLYGKIDDVSANFVRKSSFLAHLASPNSITNMSVN